MTRLQAFCWITAVIAGAWWGWTTERDAHERALDILNAHFGDFETVGVTAKAGW